MKKRWITGAVDHALQGRLSTALNISPLVSGILINRGIRDTTSAEEFLNVSYKNLIDPFRLNDMEKAVGRLLQTIKQKGRIIVSGDYGTPSTAPIRSAKESGIDVIVTDHHECPQELPPAFALLNPNRHDSTYPFKGLPGAGVAFKLIQAITMALSSDSKFLTFD